MTQPPDECGFDFATPALECLHIVGGLPLRARALFEGTGEEAHRKPDEKTWSAAGYLWHLVDVYRRLGARCVSNCIAPTAILFVIGLMDLDAMAVMTAAIFAERLAPGGLRIARLTGALALGVGLVICARAIGME